MSKKTDRDAQFTAISSAWQTLYYADLLSDKEAENISKKIKTKFKDVIKSPIATGNP